MAPTRSGRGARRGSALVALALAASTTAAEPAGPDPAAADLHRTACLRGDGEGCLAYARWLEQTGAPVVVDGRDEIRLAPHFRINPAGRVAAYYWGACRRRVAEGCARAGTLLLGKSGNPANLHGALAAFRAGCELGDDESCEARQREELADLKEPPADPRRAEEACAAGHGAACTAAGRAFAIGDGAAKDRSRALNLLRMACEAGEQHGCVLLADIAGIPLLWQQACSNGYFRACEDAASRLHVGYASGEPARSAVLREMGCVAGDGDACVGLAEQLRLGDGVPLDPAEGLRILEAACTSGSPRACGERGRSGEAGDESRRFYLQGCEGGDPLSCWWLANTYDSQDPRKVRLYLAACRHPAGSTVCVHGRKLCDSENLQSPECDELRTRARRR